VEVDNQHVTEAIGDVFSYEATDKCLIKGIKRFPAASVGVLKNNKLDIQAFWNPLSSNIQVPKDFEQQKEYFRGLFSDACKIRMQSDVPIGTALSGGLDSSAVICSMAMLAKQRDFDYQKDWQHAFVASFPGTSLDETEYAKQVTDYLNIKSCYINIDPVAELNDIYRQAYMFEEIYYAPTIPFVQLYRNISKNGIKVSIDGHGADELFGGYPVDMNYALLDAIPNPFKLKEIFNAIENTSGEKIRDKTNYLKFAMKNKFPTLSVFTSDKITFKKEKQLDFLNSCLYNSSFKTILPTLLRNYDRYSMMNGVEIRMPFLDHRIVEFAFKIPYSSKIRNGFGKAIVRESLIGVLPEGILKRKKKIGFNSPMNSWMRAEMKNWMLDTVNSQDFANCSLINATSVKHDVLFALDKKELSYSEGEKTFARIMPFIWEKSLKLHCE
jgi:asparagine synthase (glutamine-hydrolysing)